MSTRRWVDYRVVSEIPLPPDRAFATILAELTEFLDRTGLSLTPGPKGTLTDGRHRVGRVRLWEPGRGFVLEWHPAPWNPADVTEVTLRFEASGEGTRVTLEHRGFGASVGESPDELAGWVASAVLGPAVAAVGPTRLGDWLTDRRARRPSGASSRTIYQDPLFHRPNFLLLEETLRIRRSDRVLEVGCGGGALLKDLLRTGCRATGVDHSPDLLRVAAAQNSTAVRTGRLTLREGRAEALPVDDAAFTAAVSTGVLNFLPDPLPMFREVRRALVPGGRFAVFSGTRVLVGTPACPEPIASRLFFYEPDAIASMARRAGFVEVRVTLPDLGPYARAAHLPADALPLFDDFPGGAVLLTARTARGRRRSRGKLRGTTTRRRAAASPGARARRG
jgi:SAM-dependent methyltransferase